MNAFVCKQCFCLQTISGDKHICSHLSHTNATIFSKVIEQIKFVNRGTTVFLYVHEVWYLLIWTGWQPVAVSIHLSPCLYPDSQIPAHLTGCVGPTMPCSVFYLTNSLLRDLFWAFLCLPWHPPNAFKHFPFAYLCESVRAPAKALTLKLLVLEGIHWFGSPKLNDVNSATHTALTLCWPLSRVLSACSSVHYQSN